MKAELEDAVRGAVKQIDPLVYSQTNTHPVRVGRSAARQTELRWRSCLARIE